MEVFVVNNYYEQYILYGTFNSEKVYRYARHYLLPSDFKKYGELFKTSLKGISTQESYELCKLQGDFVLFFQIPDRIVGFNEDTAIEYIKIIGGDRVVQHMENDENTANMGWLLDEDANTEYEEPEQEEPRKPSIHECDKMSSSEAMEGFSRKLTAGCFDTGFPTVDRYVKFRPGKVVVLGASTNTGKTALSLLMAVNVALEKRKVLFITQGEMNRQDMYERIISMTSGFPSDELLFHQEAFKILDKLRDYLIIKDTKMKVSEIEKYCLEEKEDTGKTFDFVVVDYINTMEIDTKFKSEARYIQLGRIVSDLGDFGGKEGICFMINAQRQREGTSQPGISPLYSLKESGNIENCADVVLILERKPGAKEGTISVEKNRHGQVHQNIKLNFDGRTTKYSEV